MGLVLGLQRRPGNLTPYPATQNRPPPPGIALGTLDSALPDFAIDDIRLAEVVTIDLLKLDILIPESR